MTSLQITYVVKSLAKISTFHVLFVFGLAIVSGFLALVGALASSRELDTLMRSMSVGSVAAIIGFLGFAVFFPLTYVIVLAKEIGRLSNDVEQLRNRLSLGDSDKKS